MLSGKTNSKLFAALLAIGGTLAGVMLYGCASGQNSPTTQSDAPATQPAFVLFGPPPHESGVQLWSENCARCHNGRPPEEFSASQWSAIVHHMRLRANLTGQEEREITKFLQASN
jgi:hypothetical protein